jgi:phage anti-repressor protein
MKNQEFIKTMEGMTQSIPNQPCETVSARALHKFLLSKQEFANWIKNRIEKYDFVDNEDYFIRRFDVRGNLLKNSLDKFIKTENQAYSQEYDLTINMAKELGMLEGNERGKIVRRHFISVDNRARELMTPIEGVFPIFQNGVLGYPRKEILTLAGYSYNSGYVGKLRKKYSDHFFHIGRTACISRDMATFRLELGKVRQLVLDFDNKNNVLKGGNND